MPTYDYECAGCGAKIEVFQPMSASPKRKCPKCGKNGLKRLIGAGAGFIFKGSGFYITDYRSEDYKAKAKAETEGGKPAAGEAKSGDAKTGDAKSGDAKSGDTKAERSGTQTPAGEKKTGRKKDGGKAKPPAS